MRGKNEALGENPEKKASESTSPFKPHLLFFTKSAYKNSRKKQKVRSCSTLTLKRRDAMKKSCGQVFVLFILFGQFFSSKMLLKHLTSF